MLFDTYFQCWSLYVEKHNFLVYNDLNERVDYPMGMSIKIRTLLLERKMTIKELAEKIGTNGSNLSNKLSRDNFSEKELRDIAEALDCGYEATFTMRDTGKKV